MNAAQHALTLRFLDPTLEEAFCEFNARHLRNRARGVGTFAAVHCGMVALAVSQKWTWYPLMGGYFSDGSIRPMFLAFIVAVAVLLTIFALILWFAPWDRLSARKCATILQCCIISALSVCALLTTLPILIAAATAVSPAAPELTRELISALSVPNGTIGEDALAMFATQLQGLYEKGAWALATYLGAAILGVAAGITHMQAMIMLAITLPLWVAHNTLLMQTELQGTGEAAQIRVQITQYLMVVPVILLAAYWGTKQVRMEFVIMRLATKPSDSLPAEVSPVPTPRRQQRESQRAHRHETASAPTEPVPSPSGKWAKIRTTVRAGKLMTFIQDAVHNDAAERANFLDASGKVRKQINRMERRTIRPDGRFLRRWDFVLMIAMAFVATATPFEVAFVTSTAPASALFITNRIIDVIFVVDIVLNFFIPYRQSAKQGGRWVYNSESIAKHYLKGWFPLDAITAVPVELLLSSTEISVAGANAARMIRLVKMARIVRLRHVAGRWLARLQVDLSVLELIKFLFMTIFVAHWLACLWGFCGNNFSDNAALDVHTWYIEAYNNFSWVQKHQLTSATPFELYSVAVYVALSNIFGGALQGPLEHQISASHPRYQCRVLFLRLLMRMCALDARPRCTGPCDISPANYIEFLVQGLMMLLGSSLWAYIIGSGCSIVATLTPNAEEHRRIISMLNYFVRDKKLDPDLALRLRRYYNETNQLRYFEGKNQELMQTMTSQLRGESALASAKAIFSKVSYLSAGADRVEPDFLSKAALLLTTAVYCPKEPIPRDMLTIVIRGLVSCDGRIGLKAFAEDMIIENQKLRDMRPASALTITQVSRLARLNLMELLVGFPRARRWIHKQAVRITFQRMMVLCCAASKKQEQLSGTPISLAEAVRRVREDVVAAPQCFAIKGLDEKVDELHRSVNGRVDELSKMLSTVMTDVRSLGIPAPRAIAPRAACTKRQKLTKAKSVPPPLRRSSATSAHGAVVISPACSPILGGRGTPLSPFDYKMLDA